MKKRRNPNLGLTLWQKKKLNYVSHKAYKKKRNFNYIVTYELHVNNYLWVNSINNRNTLVTRHNFTKNKTQLNGFILTEV